MREDIDAMVTRSYEGTELNDTEYRLVIRYNNDANLKEQIDDLLHEIRCMADLRNCVADDMSVKNEANGLYWDEYNGGWK